MDISWLTILHKTHSDSLEEKVLTRTKSQKWPQSLAVPEFRHPKIIIVQKTTERHSSLSPNTTTAVKMKNI